MAFLSVSCEPWIYLCFYYYGCSIWLTLFREIISTIMFLTSVETIILLVMQLDDYVEFGRMLGAHDLKKDKFETGRMTYFLDETEALIVLLDIEYTK